MSGTDFFSTTHGLPIRRAPPYLGALDEEPDHYMGMGTPTAEVLALRACLTEGLVVRLAFFGRPSDVDCGAA